MQGRGGPASREAWSGHSTASLEATWAAMVPLSPSPIWPSISPIHPSLPALSACLCAYCSLSHYNRARPRWLLLRERRESPIWSPGETEERWEEDREAGQQQTRCILVKAKDWLELLKCSFFIFKSKRKCILNNYLVLYL